MQQVFAHCCLVGHWGEIFEFGVLDVPFLRFEVRAEVEHANLRVLLLLALRRLGRKLKLATVSGQLMLIPKNNH